MRLNPDLLNNMPPEAVALASFEVIDALQRHHLYPANQVGALAATFLLVCSHLKLDPQDVFTATKNLLMADRYAGRQHFNAVKLYVENEIK